MSVRVRFAPSPTGYLHIGGVRTALFNWLFAKANGGTFILRIEDTDRNRYVPEAEAEIINGLKWLGLNWDEGPDIGGNFGPYYQSHRTELYKEKVQELIDNGHAYRCFCTPERLQKMREEQQDSKEAGKVGYDGHCRNLSKDEEKELLDKGQSFVVRFKIPDSCTVSFEDMVRGKIEYKSEVLDDLVLLKTDGFPTYHLANVIDDHYMEISHVLRGDEWISSTPRHVLIYKAFGWETPKFAHMPVILSSTGGKLSKRKGAASINDYKEMGFLPDALTNFLSLLGWAPGDDREIMTIDEIIKSFTIDRISPKPAVLDEKKMEWMNSNYLREKSVDDIKEDIYGRWKSMGYLNGTDENYLKKVIELLKDRSKTTKELAENSKYFFNDPEDYENKAVKKHFKGDAVNVLKTLKEKLLPLTEFNKTTIESVYQEYADASGLSGGKLIHPTRLAVSGVSFGPGIFELLEVIGKDVVIKRIETAISWISNR